LENSHKESDNNAKQQSCRSKNILTNILKEALNIIHSENSEISFSRTMNMEIINKKIIDIRIFIIHINRSAYQGA
jgi:hypothetical protein